MKLQAGKLNICIGGQFGSEGKGLLASYLANKNHIDISITNAANNAGHTFYYHNKKYVSKYIPVSSIINDRNTIYLCSGAIIHAKSFLEEVENLNIEPERICIDSNCAIIEDSDIDYEKELNSSVTKIASTQSGVGKALCNKVNRSGKIAKDERLLKYFVKNFTLKKYLDEGCVVLMEVPQGLDLSLSSKFYPYCTSREISISAALSDCKLHPKYLGKTAVCIRTFPIRVGNIINNDIEIGFSGDFYSDSNETKWESLKLPPEFTTVTKRKRRVATFSFKQYTNMLNILYPDYILLNFCNYLNEHDLSNLLSKLPEVTHLSFGPYPEDVLKIKG